MALKKQQKAKTKTNKQTKRKMKEFPGDHQLKIHHCHCCVLGHCYGVSLIPGPGTYIYHRQAKKKKKKNINKMKGKHRLGKIFAKYVTNQNVIS